MDNVFKRKHKKVSRLRTIQEIYGLRETSGDVGLEVEVEGINLPNEDFLTDFIPRGWTYHSDGSLRGEENAEYVLTKPVPFDDVQEMAESLFGMFAKADSVLDESNRTSVHVHLNVQQFKLNRLCSFICLYVIAEELLTRSCGEHREGNLFCLSTKDAPGIISTLKQFFKTDASYAMFPNGFHYSGMNTLSLSKFGSLEFRTMRGARKAEDITQWVDVLRRLYDMSESYPDPRDVVSCYSGRGSWGFLADLLGPHFNRLVEGIPSERIDRIVLQGVRRAQAIAFCRDWSDYTRVIKAKNPDPFGRDLSEKVLYPVDIEPAQQPEYYGSPFFPNSVFVQESDGLISLTDEELNELEEYFDED